MTFFGMYPNNYIGGNPMGAQGGLYGNAHPSFTNSFGNINYFSGNMVGAQPAVQNGYNFQNTIPQTQVVAQNQIPQYIEQNPNLNQNNPANSGDIFSPQTPQAQLQNLQNAFKEINSKQGIAGKLWNGIKNTTGLGLGSKKCQKYITSFMQGQMSYEDVMKKINQYDAKQTGAVNMLSGFASGLAAIGLAAPTGGLSLGTILSAGIIGGGVKAGIKTFERATNDKKGDALNAKEILKDGVSGALNGTVGVATAGIGKGAVQSAETLNEAIKQGVISGAKAGAIAGAAQGAGDYTIECAFEKDKDFEAGQMLSNTAYSAVAGGLTGAVIGAVSGNNTFKKNHPEANNIQNEQPKTEPQNKTDVPERLSEDDVEILPPENLDNKGAKQSHETEVIDTQWHEVTDNPKGMNDTASEINTKDLTPPKNENIQKDTTPEIKVEEQTTTQEVLTEETPVIQENNTATLEQKPGNGTNNSAPENDFINEQTELAAPVEDKILKEELSTTPEENLSKQPDIETPPSAQETNIIQENVAEMPKEQNETVIPAEDNISTQNPVKNEELTNSQPDEGFNTDDLVLDETALREEIQTTPVEENITASQEQPKPLNGVDRLKSNCARTINNIKNPSSLETSNGEQIKNNGSKLFEAKDEHLSIFQKLFGKKK